MKGRSLECHAFYKDVPVYLRLRHLRVAFLARCTAISPRTQPITFKVETTFHTHTSLGVMRRIAFRLLLSSCVCVCLCVPCFWTSGKGFEIETSFFKLRGITPDITCKILTQIGLKIPRWRKNGGCATL